MSRTIRIYSVVSSPFRYGFLVMARTLLANNAHHQLSFRVLYHPDLSPLSESERNWLAERIPELEFHEVNLDSYGSVFRLRDEVFLTPKRLWAAFLVLEAFADDFEGEVVCLDSDMICMAPLEDDLFRGDEFAAVEARAANGTELGYFNTGVMRIGHSHRGVKRYREIMEHTDASSYDPRTGRADQALLSLIYTPEAASCLPWRYNVTRRQTPVQGLEDYLSTVRAVFFHYVGAKPWHVSLDPRDIEGHEAEHLWDRVVRAHLTEGEYLGYLEEWRDRSRELAREQMLEQVGKKKNRAVKRKHIVQRIRQALIRRTRKLGRRLLGGKART